MTDPLKDAIDRLIDQKGDDDKLVGPPRVWQADPASERTDPATQTTTFTSPTE
ncbi:hypothetical protein QN239_25670 [Mycolicibacterium sp. Y3]